MPRAHEEKTRHSPNRETEKKRHTGARMRAVRCSRPARVYAANAHIVRQTAAVMSSLQRRHDGRITRL